MLARFWFVECLALAGDPRHVEQWFQTALGRASDLGLLSEEVEPVTGRPTGDFPQAFSHVGLINAAWRLNRAAGEPDGQDEPAPPS